MRPASTGADGSWITEFPYTVDYPIQWPDLILSSSTTGLLNEGAIIPLHRSLTPVAHHSHGFQYKDLRECHADNSSSQTCPWQSACTMRARLFYWHILITHFADLRAANSIETTENGWSAKQAVKPQTRHRQAEKLNGRLIPNINTTHWALVTIIVDLLYWTTCIISTPASKLLMPTSTYW